MQTPTNRILCFLTTTMLVTFINNTPDKTQKPYPEQQCHGIRQHYNFAIGLA